MPPRTSVFVQLRQSCFRWRNHARSCETSVRTLARSFLVTAHQAACEGSFGDTFFTKENASSDKDDRAARQSIIQIACTAYVCLFRVLCLRYSGIIIIVALFTPQCFRLATFEHKFNRNIGFLRLLSVTIKETAPPRATVLLLASTCFGPNPHATQDAVEYGSDYQLHSDTMSFKACVCEPHVDRLPPI